MLFNTFRKHLSPVVKKSKKEDEGDGFPASLFRRELVFKIKEEDLIEKGPLHLCSFNNL